MAIYKALNELMDELTQSLLIDNNLESKAAEFSAEGQSGAK